MYKYKTHQTEHDHKYSRDFVKTSSVRSGQTLPLRQLVASAQRGMLPDSVTFNRMDSNGFIPPQYDRSHLAERFNRIKELTSELDSIRKRQSKPNNHKEEETPPVNSETTDVNPVE